MKSIGLIKETKDGEWRVALSPGCVKELVDLGLSVSVETDAGRGAGYADSEYLAAGAQIVDGEEAWQKELVVKVKEPQPHEYTWFHPSMTLFAFLHLAAEPQLAAELADAQVEAYAFEDYRGSETGTPGLPILAPMSQVAGRAAGIIGPLLLSEQSGGPGILPGGVVGAEAAVCTIYGLGVAGEAAARSLKGLGAHTIGVDINKDRVKQLLDEGILAEGYSPENAENLPARSDLIIGAALVPGRRAPTVVTSRQVADMRRGSVIIDIAIDQGGCVETSRPTSHGDPTYTAYGVTHYCVTNMPGQYPKTATQALSRAVKAPLAQLAHAAKGYSLDGALAVSGGIILR